MAWGHDCLSKTSKQAVIDFFFSAGFVTFSYRFLEHGVWVWVGYGVLQGNWHRSEFGVLLEFNRTIKIPRYITATTFSTWLPLIQNLYPVSCHLCVKRKNTAQAVGLSSRRQSPGCLLLSYCFHSTFSWPNKPPLGRKMEESIFLF